MANEVQISTSTASEVPGVVASGDYIPFLVINSTRIKSLPNVPATAEKGINVVTTKPRGFFGPKGMNPAHVKVIADAIKVVCDNTEFQESMAKLGFDVVFVDSAKALEQTKNWIKDLQPFFDEFKKK
jgi:tripartite-type tricarboxylate transporter receptor subunit TctC